jgi:hypothetical protein
MPVAGLRELEDRVKASYPAGRFAVSISAGAHTYTETMLAEVRAWFRRHLRGEE